MRFFKDAIDIIDQYNEVYGYTIVHNDTYYMYGDEDSPYAVYIGTLSKLYQKFMQVARGCDLNDDEIFGDVVDDAVEYAAESIISMEDAFRRAVRAAIDKYGLG